MLESAAYLVIRPLLFVYSNSEKDCYFLALFEPFILLAGETSGSRKLSSTSYNELI